MPFFVILFVILAAVMVVVGVIANRAFRKRDVDQMKSMVAGRAPLGGEDATPLMKKQTPAGRNAVAHAVLGKKLTERMRDYIEQAGLDWDPTRTIYLALLLALIGFNVFWYIIPRGQIVSWVGVIVGAGAPFFFLYRKRFARFRQFEEQFPDALEFVARAMKSGHAFSVSLEMLHKEFRAPLGTEFRRTFDEQNLGLPMEIALERLGTRVPLLDVRFLVSAVMLQKRTGGNLAGLLENLAYLIRERFKLRGRVRAVSAHGRISGLVLSMIPLAVAVLMFYTNPTYVLFFFDDPDGKIMLVICIILQFLGFVSIRKIVDIGMEWTPKMRQLVKHLFTVNGERCHDVVQEKVFRRVQVTGGEAGRGGSLGRRRGAAT